MFLETIYPAYQLRQEVEHSFSFPQQKKKTPDFASRFSFGFRHSFLLIFLLLLRRLKLPGCYFVRRLRAHTSFLNILIADGKCLRPTVKWPVYFKRLYAHHAKFIWRPIVTRTRLQSLERDTNCRLPVLPDLKCSIGKGKYQKPSERKKLCLYFCATRDAARCAPHHRHICG